MPLLFIEMIIELKHFSQSLACQCDLLITCLQKSWSYNTDTKDPVKDPLEIEDKTSITPVIN